MDVQRLRELLVEADTVLYGADPPALAQTPMMEGLRLLRDALVMLDVKQQLASAVAMLEKNDPRLSPDSVNDSIRHARDLLQKNLLSLQRYDNDEDYWFWAHHHAGDMTHPGRTR